MDSRSARESGSLTPMMKQYFRVKEQHEDHVVFFRLGDFYEMFFEDAQEISKVLGLALTGRDCGLSERAPMCGIPYHSSAGYIARLVRAGYKVAICEQMEDPASAKGVVSREVVRVVTPGTLMEDHLLEEDSNNFLCSIFREGDGYGLAFADISTGEMILTELPGGGDDAVVGELARYTPREVIFNPAFLDRTEIAKYMREKLCCTADIIDDEKVYAFENAVRSVLSHFKRESLGDLGLEDTVRSVSAAAALLAYLRETQRVGLERLCTLQVQKESRFMRLDDCARSNLELLQTLRGKEKRGSLLWVLDKTKTPMGKRLIKTYIIQPSVSPAEIERRLSAVEELCVNELLCARLAETLGGVFDLERLITRIVYGIATPREMVSLGRAMGQMPILKADLDTVKSKALTDINGGIDPLNDLSELIYSAIVEEPPAGLKEGGVISDGFSDELMELRALMNGARRLLSEMEARERESTGVKNLKIGYNKIFGYFIEVSKSNLKLVPEHYIRKQTVAGGERYITQELKELEERILSAHDRAIALEQELFEKVRISVAEQLHRIQGTASAVARLDVLCSFARVSLDNRYVRPKIDNSGSVVIKEGRHPVVERMLDGVPFVPNDTVLDTGENQIAVITGPNMAGKSTFMRQTALIVLMAQAGCFVPAASASIGIVDGIFTRIGASDDLAGGQSTFMVEMVEVARILRMATSRSLIILDEVGRGTSTYDGMSIARAVLEYIAQPKRLGAKTMFATHYHELTELEALSDRIKNYNTAVKKRGDDITFLRRISRGGADDSFGIEVSKLAGIPEPVIKRAHEILKDLEGGQPVRERIRSRPARDELEDLQLSMETTRLVEVEQAIKGLDLDTLTPIEALTTLFKLREMLA